MGGLFQAIGDAIGSVLGTVVKWVEAVLTAGLSLLNTYIIEPVMNFLGFHDEDIYNTSVIASKIFNEDTFKKTQLRESVDYMKNESIDAIQYAKNFANTGDKQFGKYYRHGKWDYLDYLPDSKINATSINFYDVEEILKSIKGNDIFILDILATTPYDIDWCKYQLQELYGYDIGNDILAYNNKYYKYGNQTYLYDSNTFKVDMIPISIRERIFRINKITINQRNVTVKTYHKTIVEVNNISDTEDSVTTTIIEVKEYTYSNTTETTIEEISSSTEIVDINTIEPSNTQQLISTDSQSAYIVTTTVSEYKLYTRVDTGTTLRQTTPTFISTTTFISLEEVIMGDSEELISDKIISSSGINTSFDIPNHTNERLYIAKYTTTNNGRLYYWMYNPTTGTYPQLNAPVAQVIGFDMYPVVMLRNSFFNVSDYNLWEINGVSRPPTITQQRYEDTVEILSAIGVSLDELTKAYSQNTDLDKLQDAFFLIGVCPSNYHWIISRVLFELFDFIYDRMPPTDDSDGYSASFRENPYNAALLWSPKAVELVTDSIGSIGTCAHYITVDTEIVKKWEILDVTGTEVVTSDTFSNYAYRNVVKYTRTDIYTTFGQLVSSRQSDETTLYITEANDDFWVYEWDDGELSTIKERYPLGHTENLLSSEPTQYHSLVIRKQINATTVKILRVNKLDCFNIIRRGVDNGGVSLKADDENLIIPLPVDVVTRLTLMERTALLGESAYLLFYAIEHQHIEWYQTKAFGNFLQILSIGITVVVTIFTFGAGTAQSVTLSTMLMAALKSVAIGVGLQLALQLISSLIDDIGLKIALSIAASVLAMYAGGAFDSFKLSTAVQLAEMPVKAVDIYMKDLGKNLNQEIKAFSEEYEQRTSANESLIQELNSGITAFDITQINQSSSTDASLLSASQFYDIAIESYKNFDTLFTGFFDSTVHSFVTNQLRLGVQEDGSA